MSNLIDRVIDTLSPYIGPTAARASIKTFLQRTGMDADAVRNEHLEQIADVITPGLRVFVGAATAENLARRLRELGKGA